MEHEHALSGVGPRRQLRESTRRVLELKRRYPSLRILGAHDPAAETILHDATRSSTACVDV